MVTFCEQKKLKKFILGFEVFCSPDLEKFSHKVVAKVVHMEDSRRFAHIQKMLKIYTIEENDGVAICKYYSEIIKDPSEIKGRVSIEVNALTSVSLPFSLVGLDIERLEFEDCTLDLSCTLIPSVIHRLVLRSCKIIGKLNTAKHVDYLTMDDHCFISDIVGFIRMMNVDTFEGVGFDESDMQIVPYSVRTIKSHTFTMDFVDMFLDDHPLCRVIPIYTYAVGLQELKEFFDKHHMRLDMQFYADRSKYAVSKRIRDDLMEYFRVTYNVAGTQ